MEESNNNNKDINIRKNKFTDKIWSQRFNWLLITIWLIQLI